MESLEISNISVQPITGEAVQRRPRHPLRAEIHRPKPTEGVTVDSPRVKPGARLYPIFGFSVGEAEQEEGYYVGMGELDIILNDVSPQCVLDLLLTLVPAANLKCRITDTEIGNL